MRVLMVTDFYWPFVGGVEQHVRNLSTALVARGHDVAVATLKGSSLPSLELDGAIRVHRLSATMQRATNLFSQARTWAPPFPDPEFCRALRHVLRREQPDIVHGHDWLARSFLPFVGHERANFVMSLHYYTLSCPKKSLLFYNEAPCTGPGPVKCFGCSVEHYGRGKGPAITLSNWAMSAVERRAVDIFLPVSQATAAGNGLIDSGLPFQVVPNFVPDEVDAEPEDSADYVAQLPREGFFLFVGDLRRFKGIDVLLRAYDGTATLPPLVLIGKVWPETPATLPPNVIRLGPWPNHAVMEAWRRCIAAVVPSIGPEPFGLVALEAMLIGRPVIASSIGGLPDLVVDGETGILVPPGDAAALREALVQLWTLPERRQRLGMAAMRKAVAFRASVVVPRIEQVYRDLLAGGTPPRGKEGGALASHWRAIDGGT